jgi:pyridoxamine 5'-phosphate oxidase
MQAVADLRKEYSASGLEEREVPSEPLTLFRRWLDEAVAAQVIEPNAMCLSTVSSDGKPSGRYVLLKGLDERGFVWYTNYQSRKGQELAAAAFQADGVDGGSSSFFPTLIISFLSCSGSPTKFFYLISPPFLPPTAPAGGPPACLTFWWGDLERSVRIEGTVERVAEAESKAYFESRPRGSRIGAWASNQSRPIASRTALEAQYEDVCAQFGGEKEEGNEGQVKPVPKPEHWGGFRLVPIRVEFWKGRQSRLHDRLAYTLQQEKAGGKKKWGLERLQP